MGKKTKVITITSGKGGVGKSNISLNLAIALSKLGFSVALLDADLALGNVDLLIGTKPEYTLDDTIKKNVPIEKIIISPDKIPNFSLIPAGSGILELTKLTPKEQQQLKNEISKIKGNFDFLIIDTGAGISQEIVSFVSMANEVIIVLLPEVTSIKDSYSVLKVLKDKNVIKTYNIIVNRAKSKHQVVTIFDKFKQTVKKFLQLDVQLLGFIPEDENFQESINRQIPLINLYPNSPTSKLFKHYATILSSKLTKQGIELEDLFLSISHVVEESETFNQKNDSEDTIIDISAFVAQAEEKLSTILNDINELSKFVKILQRRTKAEKVSNTFFDNFKIGKELIFVENNVKFYSAKILGWNLGQYIICETNREIDRLFDTFDQVTARYSFEDSLIEFKTKIFGDFGSSNLILITYPKDYLITKLRDYKRVSVKIPCIINYKELKVIQGTIFDLSLKGALISTQYPCDVGDVLILNFILPNGKEIKKVKAIIRNIRDKNRYGIMFTEISSLAKRRLEKFIDTYYSLFTHQPTVNKLEKISGELKDFPFSDIIQIASASNQNLSIEFYTETGDGKIYIKQGKVIHAYYQGKKGLDAFYELSTLKDGEFYIKEFDEPDEITINENIDVLLLNSAYFSDTKKKEKEIQINDIDHLLNE